MTDLSFYLLCSVPPGIFSTSILLFSHQLSLANSTTKNDCLGLSPFFLGVRNWLCGVRACENMQKRVSHGETMRVGSSAYMSRYDLGKYVCGNQKTNAVELYCLI